MAKKYLLGLVVLAIVISLLPISLNAIYYYAYGAVNQDLTANGNEITTQQGTGVPVTLNVTGTAVGFFYEQPKHGILTGTPPHLTYTPKPNFNGTDTFTFSATDPTGNKSNIATINIIVNPFTPIPIISNASARIAVSYVISATMVSFVIIAAAVILRGRRRLRNETQQQRTKYSRLSDIIRTQDWDPSLSIFQFLLWTIVVLFAFFAVYLIRTWVKAYVSVKRKI